MQSLRLILYVSFGSGEGLVVVVGGWRDMCSGEPAAAAATVIKFNAYLRALHHPSVIVLPL